MKIATLATCHNRKDATLQSLNDLHEQKLPPHTKLEHVLVDDGSEDGTQETVANYFPDVAIVRGHGHLFWAGGMRYGWNEVLSQSEFDYLFVYNDDIRLYENALSKMLMAANAYEEDYFEDKYTVVGAFKSATYGTHTHGGRVKAPKLGLVSLIEKTPPEYTYSYVDTMNMNGCLISAALLTEIGFLAEYFIHGGADFEYGIRVISSGYKNIYCPGYIGTCELNKKEGSSREFGIGLIERYKRVIGVKEYPIAQQFKFSVEHGSWLAPIVFIKPYLAVLGSHMLEKCRGQSLMLRC